MKTLQAAVSQSTGGRYAYYKNIQIRGGEFSAALSALIFFVTLGSNQSNYNKFNEVIY